MSQLDGCLEFLFSPRTGGSRNCHRDRRNKAWHRSEYLESVCPQRLGNTSDLVLSMESFRSGNHVLTSIANDPKSEDLQLSTSQDGVCTMRKVLDLSCVMCQKYDPQPRLIDASSRIIKKTVHSTKESHPAATGSPSRVLLRRGLAVGNSQEESVEWILG